MELKAERRFRIVVEDMATQETFDLHVWGTDHDDALSKLGPRSSKVRIIKCVEVKDDQT